VTGAGPKRSCRTPSSACTAGGAACGAFAVDRLAATTVVGYAAGDELAAARAAGFTPAGPLRMWRAF
jgi:hypothetical protein